MIKKIFCLIYICFSLSCTYSQSDCLTPAAGVITSFDYRIEYDSNLKRHLLSRIVNNDLNEKAYITFFKTPSFENETAFVIKRVNDEYLFVVGEMQENIWQSGQKENVPIEITQKKISLEDVDLLGQLWEEAISKAKFNSNRIPGCDGTNYYFANSYSSGKCAYTWSPKSKSKAGRLVSIGEWIITLAKTSSDNKIHLNDEIRTKIKDLIIEFQKQSFYLWNQKYSYYLDYSFEVNDIDNWRPIFIIHLNIINTRGKKIVVIIKCQDGRWPNKPEYIPFEHFYHPVKDLGLNNTEVIRKLTKHLISNYIIFETRTFENGLELIEKVNPINHRYR